MSYFGVALYVNEIHYGPERDTIDFFGGYTIIKMQLSSDFYHALTYISGTPTNFGYLRLPFLQAQRFARTVSFLYSDIGIHFVLLQSFL